MILKPGLVAVAALAVTGCATIPTGPSIMVLPGTGKSFQQFQTDDAVCREWALAQAGVTPGRTTTDTAISGAAIGTALGAAAGAAIGAAAGSPGTGAAIGAGTGLLGGTAVGASRAEAAATSVQSRFDMSYMQCMYAQGHQIPVRRGTLPATYTQATPPPPPAGPPPPPPPAGSAPTQAVPPPPAGPPPPPPSR